MAPAGRATVLLYELRAHVPAPTAFITSGVIGKGQGKFGTQTTIKIPS